MAPALVRFLVPGTSARFRCGGLSVEQQTARLVANLCQTELVTYRERSPDHPYLDDCLGDEPPDSQILWVVSWGFDVPGLIRRLQGRRVVYHAHSSQYGFGLPPGVPVLAVSRNTLGYWGHQAPRNPLLLVPNALDQVWLDRGDRSSGQRRPIDVLVQARKSSPYVLHQLVPALRQAGLVVEVQTGWVDDLVDLFNSSTVYLYDSAEYWRGRGVTEGFGLPPLEALACGCVVFSSLNHALADYGDPGQTLHQIGCGRLALDLERIKSAVDKPQRWRPREDLLQALLHEYSESALLQRWEDAFQQLDAFDASPGIDLKGSSTWQLKLNQICIRINRVVNRLPGWPYRG